MCIYEGIRCIEKKDDTHYSFQTYLKIVISEHKGDRLDQVDSFFGSAGKKEKEEKKLLV